MGGRENMSIEERIERRDDIVGSDCARARWWAEEVWRTAAHE